MKFDLKIFQIWDGPKVELYIDVMGLYNLHCAVYYVKNQQDASLEVLFISHCKITLHVSDAFCVHHQEY